MVQVLAGRFVPADYTDIVLQVLASSCGTVYCFEILMANPLRDFLFGTMQQPKRELVEAIEPRRTFDDVILPDSTRLALKHALNQIRKRDLIFGRWGLGERHMTGQGLAFNFAGPPGTGKTVCAEAIAQALEKKLLVVRYSEMESLWAGETGKNVAAVFHSAREQDAVLFFDEADAIAGKRFANVTQGYQREANTVVNVLLKELEDFDGVVIFATNLAANFDPAFERRVRTHILFEMPGPKERAQIWRVQLHGSKTPLAEDVDFEALGEKYVVAGGDIKNAVLKAAQIAAGEDGADADKKIHQRHFVAGMDDVMASKRVMAQSIYGDGDGSHRSSADLQAMNTLNGLSGAWEELSQGQGNLEVQVDEIARRVGEVELQNRALPGIVERFDDAARVAQNTLREELEKRLDETGGRLDENGTTLRKLDAGHADLTTVVHELRDGSGALREEIERLGADSGELRTEIEKVRGQLTDGLDEVRQSRTLALREEGERAANQEKMIVELRDSLPAQLASLDEKRAAELQITLGPLQQELQVLAGRLVWAYGAAGVAIVVAIIAIVMALQ